MSLPLPELLLIDGGVKTPFNYPRSKNYPLTESWDSGGVSLSNPSEDLTLYAWQAQTDGTTIAVKREDLDTYHVLLMDSDITEVDLTFDQNMRPCIAYVADGISKLYWYDSSQNMQVITEYPLITNPRVSLDDKRRFNVANSDIIFSYIVNGNTLCYRQQRDRFGTERILLYSGEATEAQPLILKKIGMAEDNRFVFETNSYNEPPIPDIATLQSHRLAYPEAAWVAYCGNLFPSSVQWLYKNLSKVDIVQAKGIPDFYTTTSLVMKDKSTIGSGTTNQGIPIQEQVSLDWVIWALGRRVWSTLYNSNKINADRNGSEIIANDVKYVLDIAVNESIFTEYKIKDIILNRKDNNISIKFNASLSSTILSVEIGGSLYH